MFSKLKEKLKKALSIFSKKTEEVVQEEVDKVIEDSKKDDNHYVFLFHGWEGSSKSGFIPEIVKVLNKNSYEAVAYDLPNTEAPNFEEWFAFADEKLSSFKDKKISLIGHSMGGLLVLKLAEKYNVEKLVMVAPVGIKLSEEYFAGYLPDMDEADIKVYRDYQDRDINVKKIKASEIQFIFGANDPWITKEIREQYYFKFSKASFHLLKDTKHMTESEGVKKLTILESLFIESVKVEEVEIKEEDIVEEKETEKEGLVEEEPVEEKEESTEEETSEVVEKEKTPEVKEEEPAEEVKEEQEVTVEESTDADIEKLDPEIIAEKESEEVPQKFDVGKQKSVPDQDKIKEIVEEEPSVPTSEELIEETKKKYDREVAEAELKEVKDKEARTDTVEEAKERFPVPEEKETKTADLVEETKKKYDQEVAVEELKDVRDKEALPSSEDLIEESKEYKDPDHKFAENIVKNTEPAEEEYFAEEEPVKEKKKEKKSFFGKLKESLFGKDEEEVEEPATEGTKKDETVEESIKEEPEPKSFFGKIKQTLTTKTINEEKFDELFWDLELVLLENNVSVEVIEKIKEDLKEELVDKPLPRDVPAKIQETLRSTLDTILTHDKIELVKLVKEKEGPYVIALFGINGTGKTTSVAKLTKFFQNNNLSVVLAACDTFRAAAIQQLGEHATKLNVKMISHDYGSDAAAVAFDAIKYAEKNKIDVVLIDTAGRLHSNTNLMAELEKIIRVTTPDLKIFVGESITGNDCIEQAKSFNELVTLDGAILTKADVDEKGGAPLSISYVIKKPILFLGVGQNYEDLEEFDKDLILERLGF